MGYNKIIFAGKTLIDLTSDSITPEKLLVGSTAHDKSGEAIEGSCTFDVDSSEDTVVEAEVVEGKTCHARGTKITGTLPIINAADHVISSKDEKYTIPFGRHDGSGTVGIDAVEKLKIVPSNIRNGITILGVLGTMTGAEEVTSQEKTVTPTTADQIIVPDEDIDYLSQVKVLAIPYAESPNSAGGVTVTIAG